MLEECLTALEQQDCDLAQVEIDEVTRFVRHVRSKVAADDAMPGWVVLLVKFLLDVRSNILKHIIQRKYIINKP